MTFAALQLFDYTGKLVTAATNSDPTWVYGMTPAKMGLNPSVPDEQAAFDAYNLPPVHAVSYLAKVLKNTFD